MTDCSKLSANERSTCECLATAALARQVIDQYNTELIKFAADDASYKRWIAEYNKWQSRTESYSRFKNHGVSQDFTVQWGWNDWDTHNTCRECARGQKGWGEGSKFGGAWCSGQSGTLLGADGYFDKGTVDNSSWGIHVAGSRKWWKCAKSNDQQTIELNEYNAAMPRSDPQDSSKIWFNAAPPVKPSPPTIGDILCCGITFSGIEVATGNISIDNVTQNCNINKTTNQISSPSSSSSLPSTPSSTPSSLPSSSPSSSPLSIISSNTFGIALGGVSSISSVCISLAVVYFFLSNNEK